MPGVVIKIDTNPIRPTTTQIIGDSSIFCPSDFRGDFMELVFASEENDGIKKDVSDFIFKKITTTDTINIFLLKEKTVIATINNNAYGTFYNGFESNPLYIGWQADWTRIFQSFSGGKYQVKVDLNILGVSSSFLSRYFMLNTFDILSADNTVKIETIQKGDIDSSPFKFKNLLPEGWKTSIRLQGVFGLMKPAIEKDIFQDSSYREIQNRETIKREYILKANLVPETLYNRIATEDTLGNEIFITSYGVLQELKYEKFPVVIESFGEPAYDKLGNTHFEITFSDRQKNIIKTNI